MRPPPGPEPRGRGRERLAPLAALIAKTPSDKLRAAAKALWTELYGQPPLAVTP